MSSELIVMNRLELPVFQNEYLAESVRKIIECSRNIIANHFQIAYELANIKSNELYKEDGYESVTEFAEKVFGFSKTSTSLAIKIAERYLIDEGDRIATTFLDNTGTDFSFNQLRETLPLSERKVNSLVFEKRLKPTMTLKQIREIVQEEKNRGNNQSFGAETQENRGINSESTIDISASLSSSSVEPAEVSTESVNSSSDSLVSSEESDNLSEEHELKLSEYQSPSQSLSTGNSSSSIYQEEEHELKLQSLSDSSSEQELKEYVKLLEEEIKRLKIEVSRLEEENYRLTHPEPKKRGRPRKNQ